MNCPKCNSDCSDLAKFENLNEDLTCPNCESSLELNYDETWDPESGDEWGWFWFDLKV